MVDNKIITNLLEILNDEEYYDITIEVASFENDYFSELQKYCNDLISIWEHVGFAQNLELPFDIIDYPKDDFNILKNTLQQCIPFVKFGNFTSKEFLDKVLPYEQILPKELYKNLLKA
ncbi:hypothetical protein C1645_836224 [Glomus cerebriforme]|uniref:Uncharacterized protein n=1 Tax=Glomus cerebriforme TaxID=658196 RepID=A0A397SHF2_9GLOM|nr:hypothetical protein C1645_836224 [Glomus cerebriforme]